MSWIILTFLAILARAVYGIASKVLSNKLQVSSMTQTIVLTGFATILTLLINPIIGGIHITHISSLWGVTVLMVISQALGNIAYFKGIEKLEAGITQIAFSSIVIWGAFLSVFLLGSHFSLFQIAGILLLVAAILLIQYKKGTIKINRNILYILMSAGCFAVFQVTSAQLATKMSAATYLFLAYFGTTILISIFYWKKVSTDFVKLQKVLRNVVQVALFASSTSFLYFLFSYFAYKVAPDRGVVVLLLTTQVILAVILGIIFLHERERIKQKLFAGALAVVASIMIKA